MTDKNSRLFRRYKAGYEVWLETSGADFSAVSISGGEDLALAINDSPAQIITTKVARTPEGHYIGNTKRAHNLCKKRGIAPELASPDHKVCSVGFCAAEQKWYGWSHRAIYGFGIGSRVKPGDCAYAPTDKQDFAKDMIHFWVEPYHLNVTTTEAVDRDGTHGIDISWLYDTAVPNKSLRGTLSGVFCPYPDNFGRGEWTASTLDDARQMAVDFAEGVG